MIVPPPSAEKPVPVVVEMSSPLPPPAGAKLTVPPALPTSSVTALLVPVVSAIVGLLKLIVPPLLLATWIPVPVEVIEPVANVTVPAVVVVDVHREPGVVADAAAVGDIGIAARQQERRAGRVGNRRAGAEAERAGRPAEDVDAGIAAVQRRACR